MALISSTVSISDHNGQWWWCIAEDGKVTATATRDSAEKFKLVPAPSDYIGKIANYALLSTSLNKYLSRISQPGKDYIEAVKSVIDPYSQFLMDPFAPSKDQSSITGLFQADNHLFLQVDTTNSNRYVRPIGDYATNPANAFIMQSLIAWDV